ncbi:MAG: type II toxin-antitoxin system RelE/ParE family toxin [Candidatus Komeilibacteria bacterium]
MEITLHDKVAKFIYKLSKNDLSEILTCILLLEKYGHNIRMPYSKSIRYGIYELRVNASKQYRLIYFFNNNKAIIVHGFIKKSNKIPLKEIRLALTRKYTYK